MDREAQLLDDELFDFPTWRMAGIVCYRSLQAGILAGAAAGPAVLAAIYLLSGVASSWRAGVYPVWTGVLGLVSGGALAMLVRWRVRPTMHYRMLLVGGAVGAVIGMGYHGAVLLMLMLPAVFFGAFAGLALGLVEGVVLVVVTAMMDWRAVEQRAYRRRLVLAASFSSFLVTGPVLLLPYYAGGDIDVEVSGVVLLAITGAVGAACAVPAARYVAGWRTDLCD